MDSIELGKVIKGLECCMAEKICTSKCPYKGQCDDGGYYYSKAIEDAISLLKAQEPIAPKLIKMYPHDIYECGNCGHRSVGSKDYKAKYCPECGREIQWGNQNAKEENK